MGFRGIGCKEARDLFETVERVAGEYGTRTSPSGGIVRFRFREGPLVVTYTLRQPDVRAADVTYEGRGVFDARTFALNEEGLEVRQYAPGGWKKALSH